MNARIVLPAPLSVPLLSDGDRVVLEHVSGHRTGAVVTRANLADAELVPDEAIEVFALSSWRVAAAPTAWQPVAPDPLVYLDDAAAPARNQFDLFGA